VALKRTNKAIIRAGKQSGYVAECLKIPVATQGKTLDEVTRNSREAVDLHLEGEALAGLGVREHESALATLEILGDRHLTTRLRKLPRRTDTNVRADSLHSLEEVFGEE